MPRRDITPTITLEQQVQTVQSILSLTFDTRIPVAQAAEIKTELFLNEARRQIADETNEDSPWFVGKDADSDEQYTRGQMLEFVIHTRALELLKRNTEIDQAVFLTIAGEIKKRRLHLFPPTGTWTEFEDVIRDLVPAGSTSGSAAALANFFERQDVIEAAGFDASDMAELVSDKGTSTLGRIANQVGKLTREGIDEDTLGQVAQVVEDAKSMSIRDFDTKYSNPRVPPIEMRSYPYSEDEQLIVLHVTAEGQRRIIEQRLGDRLVQAEVDLLQPVTPGRIYQMLTMGVDELYPALFELLKSAVLADPACYAVYGVMSNDQHAGKWVDVDTLVQYNPRYPPQAVREALGKLTHYGLVEDMRAGAKPLWRVVNPGSFQ